MIAAFGLSAIGPKRERNEDCLLIDPGRGLFVVADGLGGHGCGDEASRLAVAAVDRCVTAQRLQAAAGRANAVEDLLHLALYEAGVAVRARQQGTCRDMGTSLLLVIVDGETAHVLGLGDSLAFRVTAVGLEALNRAHRAALRTVDVGWMRLEQFLSAGQRGRLTQCVGQRRALEPSYRRCPLGVGDRLLLCTDGLTDVASEAEIHAIASAAQGADGICQELVRCATAGGGTDDVSVVLVVQEAGDSQRGKVDPRAEVGATAG